MLTKRLESVTSAVLISFQRRYIMEIEVKYQLPGTDILNAIWNSEDLFKISVHGTSEAVPMKALYYDTADRSLRKSGLTLRVRSEGSEAFCTMKWGGAVIKGVHEREEVNIPVSIKDAYLVPDESVLSRFPRGAEVLKAAEQSPLIPLIIMEFTRMRRRLVYDGNVMELALDSGKIIAGEDSCDILEMELEHYDGRDPLSVLELGEIIADKYRLELQPKSKYARGLALLKHQSSSADPSRL